MSDRDKGIRLATYVSREVDSRLREYARRERRSVSGAAALLIEQGLEAADRSSMYDEIARKAEAVMP